MYSKFSSAFSTLLDSIEDKYHFTDNVAMTDDINSAGLKQCIFFYNSFKK